MLPAHSDLPLTPEPSACERTQGGRKNGIKWCPQQHWDVHRHVTALRCETGSSDSVRIVSTMWKPERWPLRVNEPSCRGTHSSCSLYSSLCPFFFFFPCSRWQIKVFCIYTPVWKLWLRKQLEIQLRALTEEEIMWKRLKVVDWTELPGELGTNNVSGKRKLVNYSAFSWFDWLKWTSQQKYSRWKYIFLLTSRI